LIVLEGRKIAQLKKGVGRNYIALLKLIVKFSEKPANEREITNNRDSIILFITMILHLRPAIYKCN
jgi:hypothetical protein